VCLFLAKRNIFSIIRNRVIAKMVSVKVALFAAFSISAGNLSSISASLTSFSLHSMFTNAIMWN
jgi:hypothetical protein